MIETNIIYNESCLTGLKKLPDNSIDCCVTSPPYFGLRDYGTAKWDGGDSECKHTYKVVSPYNENFNERYGNSSGQKKQESQRHEKTYKDICKDCGANRIDEQFGLESTPEEYVANMVILFAEVMRVLKPTGTLWLNIGDSYWGGKGSSGAQSPDKADERNKAGLSITSKAQQLGGPGYTRPTDKKHETIKPKDLIGIPWMVAFALRSAGWYLRQDIIWNKPNPMPESVTDRCTKAHEYIFLLSKSKKYYFDAESIKTPSKNPNDDLRRLAQQKADNKSSPNEIQNGLRPRSSSDSFKRNGSKREEPIPGQTHGTHRPDREENKYDISKANKRSVWTVTTKPFKEAHFATFPEDLIVDCIKAGCAEGGVILDPFMGAGTTALVSKKLNRNYIGFELNAEYLEIANKRINGPVEIIEEYIIPNDLDPRLVQYDLFGNIYRK